MSLREQITEAMLANAPISEEKRDKNRRFYYARYEDNLWGQMDENTLRAFENGSGGETKPTIVNKNGKEIIIPAKMASISSSSAMTFNLLGNGSVSVSQGDVLPHGTYEIQYEKQMYTVCKGSNPANLDAFLSNERNKTAIFCEMKMFEWLGTTSYLKEAYRKEEYYFEPNYSNIGCPVNAYEVFSEVIQRLLVVGGTRGENLERYGYSTFFKQYDAWQMLKHLLAIYNYTSFATKKAVNEFSNISSMAGKYNQIVLANVVNEFPLDRIQDCKVREAYARALQREQEEAKMFIHIIKESGIPRLFANNCNARIEVKYISAKEFAGSLDMSEEKRAYLGRYF